MGNIIDPAVVFDMLTPLVINFSLIISRVIGMFLSSPFFEAPQIPVQLKALFTSIISLLLLGPVSADKDFSQLHILQYAGLLICELGIGLCIGLLLMLIFSGIEFAGRLLLGTNQLLAALLRLQEGRKQTLLA